MQHQPTDITLRKSARLLEVVFSDGNRYSLPFEYLRAFSPSAEVRGHGPGQEVLQFGKQDVTIERIEPAGAYALRLCFSDGHNTGLYSWDVLHELGRNFDRNWADYLARLAAAGKTRAPANQETLP